ncbi:CaiB/BaiF CoA transferase family protein [Cupriavidus taiwanensis]|uniref:CaiB/BaiF CoA transferase family protein n=1 Tax=Cupriavidus taiwanensis TaxID=164546 RepID=UPI000E108769|nr:CaiB/BaiF CoA-transferase family protein [Cupriavidus taiwanensis]SPA57027.1 L-carnitine dehydratase/bile acid-inducible protein F [Cupriavidus taiwanensis]
MAGPLEGVRVLDLSRILAGPWSTQLLSDLGADVIKVERPGSGDDTRAWGPPFLAREDGTLTAESAYFLCANRGKRSITVDVSSEAGQTVLRELAKTADVFVENYKCGDMRRYGLDYDTLAALNPRLVYCSITGFGQTGPYSHRAGYDFVVQAMGGLMSITGECDDRPGGGPQKCGVPISDLMTGMYASVAIVSALFERVGSARGQYIDMSLLDTQVAWLANQASNYLVAGAEPRRWGNAHPNLAPYQSFATSDGALIVAVGNDRQFGALCDALDLGELARDERYATNAARLKHRESLVFLLAERFRGRDTGGWLVKLEAAGVPCGPIHTIPQALSDPQVQSRGMVFSLPHGSGAIAPQIANPIKFSRSTVEYRRAPPVLGEHTDDILSRDLGWSADRISGLRRGGTI